MTTTILPSDTQQLIMKIFENDKGKIVESENYNTVFDKTNGVFIRFGATPDDNPVMAPTWEILDWELSTRCNNVGICNKFCYKSNTDAGTTIDLNTFKSYFTKIKALNPIWHQVAYGIGSLEYIPQLPEILEYTRNHGIIPNITINSNELNCNVNYLLSGITYNCGAVSISDNSIDDTIKLGSHLKWLSRRNSNAHLKQINVHHVISNETYDKAFEMIDAMHNNPDIFNAIIFLWIKEKGRAINNFTQINDEKLKILLDYANEKNVNVGFDTCGSHHAYGYYKSRGIEHKVKNLIENCCSTRFSIYLSVEGYFSPCSFVDDYKVHIDDVACSNDVWHSKEFKYFRNLLLNNDLKCPVYLIDGDYVH